MREIIYQGRKAKCSPKQKRKAHHIEEGYEQRGIPEKEAKRRAWAMVNKIHGGGARGGSGTEETKDPIPAKKGGKRGGQAQVKRSPPKRGLST